MPRFIIERHHAELVEMTKSDADNIRVINDEEGVKWLFSFLSADRRKTFCLYEAPNAEAIRAGLLAVPRGQIEAARSLGLNRWYTFVDVTLPQAFKIALKVGKEAPHRISWKEVESDVPDSSHSEPSKTAHDKCTEACNIAEGRCMATAHGSGARQACVKQKELCTALCN